jgi:hypothetical protein
MPTLEERIEDQYEYFGPLYSADTRMTRFKELIDLLERMQELIEATCPYKVGDTVYLTKAGLATRGWSCAAHTLVVGRKAEIRSRDFYKGEFIFGLVFENETWVDKSGEEQPLDRPYRYNIPANYISKFDPCDNKPPSVAQIVDKLKKLEEAESCLPLDEQNLSVYLTTSDEFLQVNNLWVAQAEAILDDGSIVMDIKF